MITRREFLAGLATSACAGSRLPALASQAAAPPIGRPRVVAVHSELVIRAGQIRVKTVREMLETGLTELSGEPGAAAAWRKILGTASRVGLKFNRSGAAGLGTTPAMLEAMVASLRDAGWSAEHLLAVEIPDESYAEFGLARPRYGWSPEEVEISGVRDHLSALLEQVDAMINVPFLKTHNLAGMTCCLKNLSHSLVKHPALFHANGCAQIADIMQLPQIRNRVRLHAVNALRVVTDRGPDVDPGAVRECGKLLLGQDGVAVDTVALEILNSVRTEVGLERLARPPYINAASELGLGQSDLHEIDWLKRSI